MAHVSDKKVEDCYNKEVTDCNDRIVQQYNENEKAFDGDVVQFIWNYLLKEKDHGSDIIRAAWHKIKPKSKQDDFLDVMDGDQYYQLPDNHYSKVKFLLEMPYFCGAKNEIENTGTSMCLASQVSQAINRSCLAKNSHHFNVSFAEMKDEDIPGCEKGKLPEHITITIEEMSQRKFKKRA